MIKLVTCFTLFISSCSQSHDNVKKITVTVDPNKKENKYQVINITAKDSIQAFVEKLNKRETEPVKFYPRFSIEINYTDKTEKYLGNANHIMDGKGNTYKLLTKDWEIYKY